MAINYYPLDCEKINKIFDKTEILNLFDKSFCTHINKKGIICSRKSRMIIKNN